MTASEVAGIVRSIPWTVVVTVLATLIASASPFALYRYLTRPKPRIGVVP